MLNQIKSINEINLNEEYMDASIVITMEWIDKQLSWQTGEISVTPSPSTRDSHSDERVRKGFPT